MVRTALPTALVHQLNNDPMTLENSVMVGLEPVAVAFQK